MTDERRAEIFEFGGELSDRELCEYIAITWSLYVEFVDPPTAWDIYDFKMIPKARVIVLLNEIFDWKLEYKYTKDCWYLHPWSFCV